MQIKPLGDHVLVKQKKEDEVTSFGLVLSGDKKKKPEGEVVAVGPGKIMEDGKRSPMDVKVGDHIMLKAWGGDDVEVGKEEYKIVSQDDILAVIEK